MKLHEFDTENNNFKQWFAGSKIVDKKGNPLICYHGTMSSFDSFDGDKSNTKSKTGVPSNTFFFTTSQATASSYAGEHTWMTGDKEYKENGNVLPVVLNIKKPLLVNANGDAWNNIRFKDEDLTINEIVQYAKTKKYDGVIVKNVSDNGQWMPEGQRHSTIIVAFNSNQIKSVFNNGMWSDTNKISEDMGRKYLKTSKFWFNTKTNEVIWVPDSTHHTKFIQTNPNIIGITNAHMKSMTDADDEDLYDLKILWHMITNKWVRVISSGYQITMEVYDYLDARKTLKWLEQNYNFNYSYAVIEQRLSDNEDGPHNPYMKLRDAEEIQNFIKYGRKITEKFSSSLQHFQEDKFWFNIKTNEIVWIPDHTHHSMFVRDNPNKFGISDIFDITDNDSDDSYDTSIIWYMLQHDWIRAGVNPLYGEMGGLELYIEASTVNNARKSFRWIMKHIELNINRLMLDIRTDGVKIRDKYYKFRDQQSIEAFSKYGKLIESQAHDYPKFWFNAQTKEIIRVPSHDHHTSYVKIKPEIFGYTKDQVADAASNSSEIYDDGILLEMLKRHWVRGSISKNNEINLEVLLLNDAQETLRFLENQIIPELVHIDELGIRDNHLYIKDRHFMFNDRAIENFTKRGRLPRRMAESIMESVAASSIVGRIKKSYVKEGGQAGDFKNVKQVRLPSISGFAPDGRQTKTPMLREIFETTKSVVNFLHKNVHKIENFGWYLASVEQKGDGYTVFLETKPTAQQLGLLFYPCGNPDEILQKGINEPDILLGKTPAAAKLIALRNIKAKGWAFNTISIMAIDAQNTNLGFYPHKEYTNCVYTNGIIDPSCIKKHDDTLDL